jgi:hypothetical protein
MTESEWEMLGEMCPEVVAEIEKLRAEAARKVKPRIHVTVREGIEVVVEGECELVVDWPGRGLRRSVDHSAAMIVRFTGEPEVAEFDQKFSEARKENAGGRVDEHGGGGAAPGEAGGQAAP